MLKDIESNKINIHNKQFNKEITNIKKTLLQNLIDPKVDALKQFVANIDASRNIKITNYIPNFYNYL